MIANYVRSFVPDAVAIRTVDDPALEAVAARFGASYGTTSVDGDEEVFHTGSLYAVNEHGDLVLTWPFGTSPAALESDIRLLLDRVDAT